MVSSLIFTPLALIAGMVVLVNLWADAKKDQVPDLVKWAGIFFTLLMMTTMSSLSMYLASSISTVYGTLFTTIFSVTLILNMLVGGAVLMYLAYLIVMQWIVPLFIKVGGKNR